LRGLERAVEQERLRMVTRVDANGKVFTDHVRKERFACIIQTVTQRIRGEAFRERDHRIMDDLNNPDAFIALTHAEVLGPADEVLARAQFMLLNKKHIVWVLPADDRSPDDLDLDADA
jgi:hypothetical protein